MHQTLYPFVINGPDCECSHRRLGHVEKVPGTSRTVSDGACQACPCRRYRAAGETFAEWEQRSADEMVVTDRMHDARMAEISRRAWRETAIRALALLAILGSAFLPDPPRSLVVGGVVSMMAFESFASARRTRANGDRTWALTFNAIGVLLVAEAVWIGLGWAMWPMIVAFVLTVGGVAVAGWRETRRGNREHELVLEFLSERWGPTNGPGRPT